jgi:hypothetical protein
MPARVKEAVGVFTGLLHTALGWGLVVVVFYALLFVNMTGKGTLWDSLRGLAREAAAPRPPTNASVQRRVVPLKPVDDADKAQGRMLSMPEGPDNAIAVTVLAPNQPARVGGSR